MIRLTALLSYSVKKLQPAALVAGAHTITCEILKCDYIMAFLAISFSIARFILFVAACDFTPIIPPPH